MRPLGEILSLSVQYLASRNVASSRLVVELLLAHLLKMKRIDLYLHFDLPLKEEELTVLRALLKEAAAHKPVEYILQEVEFYGCRLQVSSAVLIPRKETEILVDKAVGILRKESLEGKVVLDLCAGSGCMGLSIKKTFPSLHVVLSDMSEEAVQVCVKNALQNQLDVECLLGDFLTPFAGKKADFVFCNPPYVTNGEYESLEPSVKNFEPRLALVSGPSGLEFYERLARELPAYLVKGAKLFLEIGTGQGEKLFEIFSSHFWKTKELLCDFAGHDRFFFLEIE